MARVFLNNILRKIDFLLIGLVFILLVPIVGLHRLTDFIIFCLFVLSYDLLYGYMGRLSFGHMLYFGTGAYAAALFAQYVSAHPLPVLLFALAAGAAIGFCLGPIVVRTTGSCFALINMAFNQVGYFLALTAFARYTGGEDGLPVTLSSWGPFNPARPQSVFVLALFLLIACFWLVKRLTGSTFGSLLRGIKENETRMRFLGYNTFNYKWLAFCLSTALAGLAGAVGAINFGYVTTSLIDPQRNIEVIFAALMGGPGTLYGAVLGGILFMTVSNYLAAYITRWEMFLGLALLILVFRFPRGLAPYLADLRRRRVATAKASGRMG
ncbi:MAG: branched-chain amino acid ABC transporter permease [Bacillota bacterium]